MKLKFHLLKVTFTRFGQIISGKFDFNGLPSR